ESKQDILQEEMTRLLRLLQNRDEAGSEACYYGVEHRLVGRDGQAADSPSSVAVGDFIECGARQIEMQEIELTPQLPCRFKLEIDRGDRVHWLTCHRQPTPIKLQFMGRQLAELHCDDECPLARDGRRQLPLVTAVAPQARDCEQGSALGLHHKAGWIG